MKRFEKKIQEQAKSTQGTRTDLTSYPNGEKVKSTRTDKELAKLAGVVTGKIIRLALRKEKIIVVKQPLIRLSKRIGVYLFE